MDFGFGILDWRFGVLDLLKAQILKNPKHERSVPRGINSKLETNSNFESFNSRDYLSGFLVLDI